MIYNPICHQVVTIIGRYPVQKYSYRFGKKEKGTFQFVKVRYGEVLPNFKGGYKVGTEKDCDVNYLVADDGALEISKAVKAAPELDQNEESK